MSEPTIVTVRGPMPAGQLGVTLTHEHIFINLLREFRGDGLLNDPPLAARELTRFREAGGATVVDVTNASLGRHPKTLQAISEQVGVNVVLGAGLYRHQYFDAAWVDRTSTDAMAEWIVRDLTVGIDDTGIRAGIIGEIACDEWITAQEERVFRAAARAHKKTGITITTHAARWPIGLAQLDLLAEEGVDLRRVIVGHCDTVNAAEWTSPQQAMEYHEALAGRGAYVQFDTIRRGSEHDMDVRLAYTRNLIQKGYTHQILLSHDVCLRSHLREYGGGGYDFILTDFLPRLRSSGVSDETIRGITMDNPRRALTGSK
jgi:predicted metal-dependent phosphotriesterase family hydrolase